MSAELLSAPNDAVIACESEREAMLASIAASGLKQYQVAGRMRVSSQVVSKWLRRGIPSRRVSAFCEATGTLLLMQYHAHQRALRMESGQVSEADRIERLAAMLRAA